MLNIHTQTRFPAIVVRILEKLCFRMLKIELMKRDDPQDFIDTILTSFDL